MSPILSGPARTVSTAGTSPTRQIFGVYQGSVVNINDPLKQGRVQVTVPQVLGAATSNWAPPLGQSSLVNPVSGSQFVYVMFIGGDINQPVYLPQTWSVAPPSPNLHLTGTLTVDGASTQHAISATTVGATGLATLSGGATVTGGATIDIVNQALTIFKPSDESRGSTSVLNDTDLNMPVAANAQYSFDLLLYVSGSGTGALQYQFNKPGASAGKYTAYQYNLSGGFQAIRSTLSANNTASVNNPNTYGLTIKGVLDNTGLSSGTFNFQWAQNTNNGSTTIEQYSYFRMVRMI